MVVSVSVTPGSFLQIGRDALGQGRGGGQRRAFGRAHVDFKLRLVVNRQKVFPDKHEQRHDADNHEHASQRR